MKEIIFNCLSCGEEHTSKNKYACKAKYCSIQCQQNHLMQTKVESGEASHRTIKKFLLKEHGEKCWLCGITEWFGKPLGFELEHKDGNSDNNNLSNLSILCPNCHSQTPTYKAKNKGKGRHSRRIRYREGKSF